MMRASDPHGRRHERVDSIRDHPCQMVAQKHIGFERKVGSVLLEGAERHDDGVPPSLDPGFHLRPRQLAQLDRAHRALLSSKFRASVSRNREAFVSVRRAPCREMLQEWNSGSAS